MALRLASRQGRLVVFGYNAVTKGIAWVRSPYSPQYAGSPLSLAGGQVMAYYKDGTASDITASCGYDPEEGWKLMHAGAQNINASYTDHAGNGFTADTKIEVADVEELLFTGIEKTLQKEAEPLDLSGAVLTALYTDGTSREVDASGVIFSPSEGSILGHTKKQPIQARWRNPDTGSEYYAQYTLNVDVIEGLDFIQGPDKTEYTGDEPLDLTGVEVVIKYEPSGDTIDVTDLCTFYPAEGSIIPPDATVLRAIYPLPGGGQSTCLTILNAEIKTISISEIGQTIGEDLGLEFTDELPTDFWDGFSPQDVPYISAERESYVLETHYSNIVDYLNMKGAFADYQVAENIPFMKLPAGKYVAADGVHYVETRSELYIIAAVERVGGKPETLPGPSCVDYPYTNTLSYNQVQLLTFTLNSSDYIRCNPGLKGSYNSATAGIVRKLAGLGLPDVSDDTMFTNYVTFPDKSIVDIPGILALPWCWYRDVPHDISVLRSIVQNGTPKKGCQGINHVGKVPYLTYSKGSIYDEVKEQFPELFDGNVYYNKASYIHVKE